MKNFIVHLLVFCPIFLLCQQEGTENNREMSSQNIMLYSSIVKPSSNDIEGTPYLYDTFQKAKVQGFSQTYEMRYNAANDEVEFTHSGKTYTLFKQKPYEAINFIDTNDLLKLVDYKYKDISKTGYLYEVLNTSAIILYRKINIYYNKAIHATTSFDREIPANYSRSADTYFVQKKEGEIVELPLNKKKLIEMFPEKKNLIEEKFKSKNIDLSSPRDFQNFINVFQD